MQHAVVRVYDPCAVTRFLRAYVSPWVQ
jgi:hypothetical protein